jgi:hypothetical protein
VAVAAADFTLRSVVGAWVKGVKTPNVRVTVLTLALWLASGAGVNRVPDATSAWPMPPLPHSRLF